MLRQGQRALVLEKKYFSLTVLRNGEVPKSAHSLPTPFVVSLGHGLVCLVKAATALRKTLFLG